MGRNGGNSWLDVVKKALRSPTKHIYTTKTLKARMREEDEPEVDQDKKRSKRRWIFKKTALHETTTILHDESISTSSTYERSATKPIMSTQAAYSDETHAMAVAMATTAAAEAAVATVQAAVEVIRLTSSSFSFQKHNAALVIQTFFRRYLARRALEALKGVVKLQALVRGHNVRRRTKMTLKCMQALVRVQARVCDQRRKLSNEGSFDSNIFWGSHLADNNSITREGSSINADDWDRRHASRIEEIQAILQKTELAGQKNGKDLTDHSFMHQIWRSGQSEYRGHKGLEEDRKFYPNQRDPVKTLQIDTSQLCSLSPSSEIRSHENQTYYHQQQRLNSHTYSSPLYHHNFHSQSPITPSSSLSRIKPSLKVHSASPRCQREERSFPSSGTGTPTGHGVGNPSYMSATVSAMARIRPQSTPRQRMSTTEGEKKTSARKRLSFNVSEKYNGGGISDSELDCNLRSPIHTLERRLSMSSCCKQRTEGEIPRPSISEDRRWIR
ncbi:hypothetical protein Lser_V15G09600 [Lactuca serriola]